MEKLKLWCKENNSFIVNWFISITILILIFLSFYPGIITYDGNNQWQQVQSGIYTSGHPFFSTYFIYLLSRIHNSTSTIIMYQIILFSVIWGIFCNSIKCDKSKEKIKIIFTILVNLTPIIGIYAITLWKDVLYSYYLFSISIMFYIGIKKQFKYTLFEYLIFGILMTLVFSYRYNGIIVIAILIFIMMVIVIKRRKQLDIKKCLFSLFIFLILSSLIMLDGKEKFNESTLKIKATEKSGSKATISFSTMDSYMLWMTGAHLRDGNVTNKKDLSFLNNILSVSEWKKVYNGALINGTTTSNINKLYLVKNEKHFKNMFINLSLNHPITIVKHYAGADALLLNPVSMAISYVYVFDFYKWDYLNYDFNTSTKLPILRKIYLKVIDYTFLPVINLFYQPANMLYLGIILLIILSKKVYGRKIYLIGLPMILNTLSLLPINLAQDLRYVYINYLTFFGLLLIFLINYKKIFTKKINNYKKKKSLVY